MKSVDVKDFQYALVTYIDSNQLPLEVKRMVLKEIYLDLQKRSDEEIYNQLAERESKEENKDA